MEIVSKVGMANEFTVIAKPIIDAVAPKIQKTMKVFAERMTVLAEKYPSISEFAEVLDKATDITGDVLYALGIKADASDVLGAKIAQADKKMDDFESAEAYITYLKEEVEFDKEKFDSLSAGEKLAYTITGMAVEAGAIGEKLGVTVPAEAVEFIGKLSEVGKFIIEAKEIITFIIKMKEGGIANLGDICDFFKGTGESDRLKTGECMQKALDELYPGEGNHIMNDIMDEVRK